MELLLWVTIWAQIEKPVATVWTGFHLARERVQPFNLVVSPLGSLKT